MYGQKPIYPFPVEEVSSYIPPTLLGHKNYLKCKEVLGGAYKTF